MTTATVISTAEAGSDEWHRVRRAGIGGSDAAAICGVNPYRTPYAVWLEKTATGDIHDTAGEAAKWGTLLEPVVRDETARSLGVKITPAPGTYAHHERLWQHANVDGLIPNGIYEGKTAGSRAAHQWDNDQVPEHYLLQGMHYLSVVGGTEILYACLIGGQELVTRRVARDDDLIAALVKIETDFWASVQAGEPPEPDGDNRTVDLVNHLWHPEPGLIETVDRVTVDELIARRENAKAAEDDAKAERQAAENQLKMLLGEATEAHDETGAKRFTWRPQSRTGIDTKRLKAERPDVAAEYTVETISRTLRITPNTGKQQ